MDVIHVKRGIVQAARRYEVLRKIPPYLHQKIWIHTLNHSTLDEIVDRIGAAMDVGPERMLCDIVNDVLSSKTKGE
jgi:hypothetical protein